MKFFWGTIKYIFCAIFLMQVASCSSNDDIGSGDEVLTAKVDGKNYEASILTIGAVLNGKILAIQGGTNSGETIRINITNYTGVGIYKTGDALTNVNSVSYITLTPLATWSSTFNIGSGTIEVHSENGSVVEGIFSFEGVSGNVTKNITNGVFKANIE